MNRRTLLRSLAAAGAALLAAPIVGCGKLAAPAAAPVKFRTIEVWKLVTASKPIPGYDKNKIWGVWLTRPFESLKKGDVFRFTDELEPVEDDGSRSEYTVNTEPVPVGTNGNYGIRASKLTTKFRRALSAGLAT